MGFKNLVNSLLQPTHYRLVNREDFGRIFACKDSGINASTDTKRSVIEDLSFLLSKETTRMVLDVGANKGATYRLFRSLFPKAYIHCFEPDLRMREKLAFATKDDSNVALHPLAISDSEKTLTFYLSSVAETNSLFPAVDPSLDVNAPKPVTVQATTLEQFCAAHQVDSIDLLKLDIEGAEVQALEGASSLLDQKKIRCLYIELHFEVTRDGQCHPHEIIALLRRKGYDLHGLYNFQSDPISHQLGYCDGIFVPAKK